ncbi:MAG: tRNA 2-thiouridine(34) synthase MnmA [Hymenobacter sp.]
MLCNREIKFGMLLEWAKEHGYEAVATGHYAQVEHEVRRAQSGARKQSRLLRGADRSKDQSYFLAQLSQEQLRRAVFPLGGMLKRDVRKAAAERNLPVADKPDSQGLCFVGEIDLSGFLQQRIPAKAGNVVGSDGELLGEHSGAPFYTVGQRRGIGVAKGVPMYVLKTDVVSNTVTVGHDRELYRRELTTEPAHWLGGEAPADITSGGTLDSGRYDVSIRYRMDPEPATVQAGADGLQISFDEPQRGPTPGQFAVLYRGEELVGSAVIR